MSIRLDSLSNINFNRDDRRFVSNNKDKPLSQVYGTNVFGPDAIKKYILREAYESLMNSIETGEEIDDRTADFVAVGMKNWAMDNGATHFTHWFQPLTGKTAEKHDSFFTLDKKGQPIDSFGGAELVKQEPDGSSFPNGGLRQTHVARAYTIWDPSSYAFLQESSHGKTLCIPAIFITYEGDSMDLKTPLLKSANAIDKAATEVSRYFDPKVNKVSATLGWEQEYFVIDASLYNSRMDFVLTGRSLFGNASARGQQLDDHYFATIPERVHDFMVDFEDDCLMLGIPITTRHNEVAPTQFECAPIFEAVNIAADHNQLLMDLMDKIAQRHSLRVLLHEKPFKGINGSGKHNNWSLATDTGVNLLKAGDDPGSDLQFLTFFINTIKAVHDNSELMRASIASSGNEHRLGANEAPPAIISVFTGDDLEKVLENMIAGNEHEVETATMMELALDKITKFKKDKTDRNRTSPFPFTGNRFEFRAPGSSQNVSIPMTVLNTIVADQLNAFKKNVDAKIAEGSETKDAIREELLQILNESYNVVFNGDGYSDAWVNEAEKRGLPHIKSTPLSYKEWVSDKTKALFERTNIFNEKELSARYHMLVEEYSAKIDIEARTIEEIANTQIIPCVVKYQNRLIENVKNLKSIGLDDDVEPLKKLIAEISGELKKVLVNLETLITERINAENLDNEQQKAEYYHDIVKPVFDEIRVPADNLELLVEDKLWPLPKYRELLFIK